LQVKAVKRMLSDFGINSELTKPSYVIDLIGSDIGVEVTSLNGIIKRKHDSITQVLGFIQNERNKEKVLLIANTYKTFPIQSRKNKDNFSKEAIDLLTPFEICCIGSHNFYLLWKLMQEKNIPKRKIKELIFKTNGELTEEMIKSNLL
jgi:hypothetical protein